MKQRFARIHEASCGPHPRAHFLCTSLPFETLTSDNHYLLFDAVPCAATLTPEQYWRSNRRLSPTHEAPYRGLRVLDFGQGVASPYCAMLLGVYGAEIIKVEPPEGDWSRYLGTTYGGHTTLSAVYNRGKRSLCLDLKHAEGVRIAKRLARDCDVFIEGFRPGVAARLGIGYEELARDNPGLIYLSVSGFGQQGPYAKRPGSDSVAQAFSGLVSVNIGNDKTPHRVGTTISDVATGVYAFQAIATTLFARATLGTGRWIDVSLAQSTAALLGHKVAEYVLEGGTPRALNVPAGSYQTSDGWLMVTLVNEAQYKRLCTAIERDDLASDPVCGFCGARQFSGCVDFANARSVPWPVERSLADQTARGRYHCGANPQSRRMAAQRSCRGHKGRGLSGNSGRRAGLRAANAGFHGTVRG